MGLSDDLELQLLLGGLYLSMYPVTMLRNRFIILAVSSDSHLQMPTHFFLSNLSLADIGFISTTVPKMIVNIQTHSRGISYECCLTQMSIIIVFGGMHNLRLTVMSFDICVAICYPLHYPIIMYPCHCGLLDLVSFFISLLDSQLHYLMVAHLTFFRDVEIPHFFCDPSQLLKLACFQILNNSILIYFYFVGAILGGVPLSGILFSYYKIVCSILRVPSSGGKYKAFSACGSHLSVVCLFYETGFGVYLSSTVLVSPRKGVVASVMYTVVISLLSPFIYSMRNRDMKRPYRSF
ncbi:olfactory receptor 7E178-like [Rhynchonycteris naso]